MSLDRKNMAELSKLTREKLVAELHSTQKHLFSLNMKHAQGELKETHEIAQFKKYVARMKMLLRNPLTK